MMCKCVYHCLFIFAPTYLLHNNPQATTHTFYYDEKEEEEEVN